MALEICVYEENYRKKTISQPPQASIEEYLREMKAKARTSTSSNCSYKQQQQHSTKPIEK